MTTPSAHATKLHAAGHTDWLSNVPVPIFGASLGLLGLGLVSATNTYLAAIPWITSISLILGTAILAAGLIIQLIRWAIRRDSFMRDLRNVAIAPFFGQTGIAFLLLAEGIKEINTHFAYSAYLLGSAVSALLACYVLIMGVRHKFALSGITPAWLIPPIGLLYSGLLAPAFGLDNITTITLATGSLTALGAFGLLCTRLIVGPALPPPAKPALAIAVAIPALMLLALLETHTTPISIFTTPLFFITAFSYILSVAAFTKIIGGKYLLSWWAFGMPLIAAAIAFAAFSRIHTSFFSIMLSNISAFLGLATVLWLSLLSIRAVRAHITIQTPES